MNNITFASLVSRDCIRISFLVAVLYNLNGVVECQFFGSLPDDWKRLDDSRQGVWSQEATELTSIKCMLFMGLERVRKEMLGKADNRASTIQDPLVNPTSVFCTVRYSGPIGNHPLSNFVTFPSRLEEIWGPHVPGSAPHPIAIIVLYGKKLARMLFTGIQWGVELKTFRGARHN
jgi:hypothetical protein